MTHTQKVSVVLTTHIRGLPTVCLALRCRKRNCPSKIERASLSPAISASRFAFFSSYVSAFAMHLSSSVVRYLSTGSNSACTFRLLLFVRLSLCNASIFERSKVFEHWVQLCLHARLVGRSLGNCCIKFVSFFGLVLHVLLFRDLVNFIFLGLFLIGCRCHLLCRNDFSELLLQIGFCNLQQTNDAGTCTLCGIMSSVTVVII